MFYPALNLDMETVPIQEVTIRALAGFSYNNVTSDFWNVIVVTLVIFCFITGFGMLFDPIQTLSISRRIIIMEGFIQFFYWVFCLKYSPNYYEIIKSDLLAVILILFIGLITITTLLYVFSRVLIRKQDKKEKNPPSSTKYQCPYCKKEYDSNVSYCLSCKRQIR